MNTPWTVLGVCAACACIVSAAELAVNTNDPILAPTLVPAAAPDGEWGDNSNIEVQGITLGMTKQDVVRKLGVGEVKASAYATGVPYVFKECKDATGVSYRLTAYFGVTGSSSNKVVAIESMLYGASMTDRNTVVETLQEKFGFEDDYMEHRPSGSPAQLRDDYQNLPQYEQTLNEYVSLLFRIDWDNKKQRTYLITVMYRHTFYNLTAEYLRMARPDNGEEKRREQIKQIF